MRNFHIRFLATLAIVMLSDFVFSANIDNVEKRTDQDSYIDALHKTHVEDSLHSHGEYKDNSISLHSGYSYGPPSSEYGPPSNEYGPPTSDEYSAPSSSYGPPSSNYGLPSSSYVPSVPSYGAPPSTLYGPPSSSYGPPSFSGYHYGQPLQGSRPINFYNYGPSPHKFPLVQSAPRDEHWLFDKFKFKLDLLTIGKILIKLIIFKKIVKFIALICLLLFLPRLQTKHINVVDMLTGGEESEEEPDEKRSFDFRQTRQKQINEVSQFAITAIQSFTDKHLVKCGNLSDIPCRFQSMVDVIDDKYPYEKIIEMFVPVSQYYLYPPHKSKKLRKKQLNDANQSYELLHKENESSISESSTQPSIVSTLEYDVLSFMSSSSPSSSPVDHSNNNRI